MFTVFFKLSIGRHVLQNNRMVVRVTVLTVYWDSRLMKRTIAFNESMTILGKYSETTIQVKRVEK
jgi:hypothetical protein